MVVGEKGSSSGTLLLTSSSSMAEHWHGLMAASSGRGWGLGWHHGCLLAACSLPCAPFLLRDKTLEKQEFGGATSELQKCRERQLLLILEACDGGMLDSGIPFEDSGSYTGSLASWKTGRK